MVNMGLYLTQIICEVITWIMFEIIYLLKQIIGSTRYGCPMLILLQMVINTAINLNKIKLKFKIECEKYVL